ncbi:MAG: EF-Hand, Calmodulin [Candidatus Solibacter sp.]|nr:EF-Hand, Calmodulin [Candidatus Solibacter sp.]
MRLIAFALSLTALGFAQAPPPQAAPKDAFGGPGGYFRYNTVLGALDANHDNVISADEMTNATAVLKTFDKNHDGLLTADEIVPKIPEPPPEPGTQVESMATQLLIFDKNHDGKLSKAELPARMHGMFDRGDTNKDGVLTRQEIDAIEAALAPPKGDPQRERTGPPGGFIRQDPMLIALDVDHNGEISTPEMENAPAMLKKLDRNGDGQLTEDELRPRPATMSMDQVLTNMIKQYDKDGDGKISTAEMPDRLRAMFERADIDKDGFVTRTELQELIKREGGLYGDRAPAPPSAPKK